jgi:hypothetical protein
VAQLTRGLGALILVCGIVVGACSGSTNQGAAGSGSSSLSMPLPPADPEAFRQAEANLRRDGRAQAGLAQLGPGALELATLMDRTASFLLVQLPDALKAVAPPGGHLTLARSTASGSAGRFAAPLSGVQPPGAPTLFTYIMTAELFNSSIARGQDTTPEAQAAVGEKCPCTTTSKVPFTTDEVTVGGNTGTITTTMTATQTVSGSKVSLDITLSVAGEVRDAATGAVLYKIANDYTGHADGDACPDASGIARGTMTFGGSETYFDASGAKSGSGVTERFGGEMRIKADDNAKLAGVDLSTTGKGADLLMRLAAQNAAPAFEKGWQSGMCIAVLVTPEGGDVEKDSVTTVTVKVKHKIEGNELDKLVEAFFGGVKSIEPAGTKQKAPATFRYTAGSADGDQGSMHFKSVSNRGIGTSPSVAFTVGGGWTINSTGTSVESYAAGITNNLTVLIKDLKVTAGTGGALTGSGTIILSGESTSVIGPIRCTGKIDEQTVSFNVRGTFAGSGPSALLRLTLETPANPNSLVAMTCLTPFGAPITEPATPQAHIGFYRQALGEFDLPADGGTKTITGTVAVGGVLNVRATGTFTVIKAKP